MWAQSEVAKFRGVVGDAVGLHPQITWKGMIPPNEQVSRVNAVALASPQIKFVGHQIYSQMNQHDFGDAWSWFY
jgi:hypothetical protein